MTDIELVDHWSPLLDFSSNNVEPITDPDLKIDTARYLQAVEYIWADRGFAKYTVPDARRVFPYLSKRKRKRVLKKLERIQQNLIFYPEYVILNKPEIPEDDMLCHW